MSILGDVKGKFPIFDSQDDSSFVFLDTGASSQKPRVVIDSVSYFYSNCYSNIHRGAYALGDKASDLFEGARVKVADFISADKKEIIFTKNATESLNLVARCLEDTGFLTKEDVIAVSRSEHHSNLLPWISLSKRVGCELRIIELDDNGLIDCDVLEGSLSDVRVFAFNHVSNVLGCENDVKRICEIAKESDVVTVVDGCQAVAHLKVDVKDLDCDFYAFSSHKMYGPTGAGALYGKYELLERIGSFMVGGGVVQNASMNNFSLAEIPQRFEPGTQSLAEVVGFGVACDFLNELGLSNVCEYEKSLLLVLKKSLSDVDGLRELSSSYSHSIFTFVVDGFNSHDIGDELADRGVCVRVGHHCAQPLIESLGENSVVRVSFGVYNELSDVESFVKMLKESLTALS